MPTWEDCHAGTIVLGHDGLEYGVVDIERGDPRGPVVTLVRFGARVGPAQPPPGTPITIVGEPDLSAEARAYAVLAEQGLDPQVIRETYR